jgi:hypothetical protein
MKYLSSLITAKKLDYVNSDIEKNFTAIEVPANTEYKLFNFNRYISSEDAIKEIEEAGWRPANISELLSWKDWKDEVIIALGSVGEVDGDRKVPFLDRDGSERCLNLAWFDGGWNASFRFLAVRNSQSLDTSDTLTLDRALEVVKEAGYEVTPLTLAKKFKAFREEYKDNEVNTGDYFEGLVKIATKHFGV